MADFGQPVAAGVNGPQSGIQTLSSLMGLKQQQLSIAQQQIGLQQQQQELQSQTAAATVAQMNAQQYQAASKVNWASYVKPDGSFDAQGATSKMLEVAPNHPEWAERMVQTATAGAQARQSLFNLSQDYQQPIRAAFGTWAADPKAQPSDLAQQLQAIAEDAPKSEQSEISNLIRNTFSVMTGPDVFTGQPKSLEQQKNAALAYARQGLSASEVGGAQGIASQKPALLNTGGAIVPGAIAPPASSSPGSFTSQGKPVPTTLPPQIIHQPITNAPAAVGGAQGTTPKPIGAGEGKGPWWQGTWQPSPGQSEMVTGQVQALQHRINAGEMAANTSPVAIDALTRARTILDKGTWTGTTFSAFKDLKNAAAGLGLDTKEAQNASELAKNLARYEAARAGSVGDTDAARSLYEAGAPNTKMDAAAVKAVIMQSLGIEKMIQGYAKVVGGAPDPHSALVAEQRFRAVPNLVQAYELGFMRSPAEANEFLRRYGASGKTLSKSAQELRQMGAM